MLAWPPQSQIGVSGLLRLWMLLDLPRRAAVQSARKARKSGAPVTMADLRQIPPNLPFLTFEAALALPGTRQPNVREPLGLAFSYHPQL